MAVQVALLRGINVGGNRKVSMAELRSAFGAMGFEDVRTLLNSGNIVFEAGKRSGAELEAFLEAEAEQRMGLKTDFIVRSAAEIARAIEANPFPEQAKGDPSHLTVTFLRASPPDGAFEGLGDASAGPELIAGSGRELYIYYPTGMGRSALSPGMIDARVRTRGTARNWNTVLKIAAMMGV
jgi:uncharacterized protein (DUF1697 family)